MFLAQSHAGDAVQRTTLVFLGVLAGCANGHRAPPGESGSAGHGGTPGTGSAGAGNGVGSASSGGAGSGGGGAGTGTGGTPTTSSGGGGESTGTGGGSGGSGGSGGECAPGTGDCDADPTNGCETDLLTSKMDCGACHTLTCSYGLSLGDMTGWGVCNGGVCELVCDPAQANCNGLMADGCEHQFCGTCSDPCTCADGCTGVLLASAQTLPQAVALAGDVVYFATHPNGLTGSISSVALAGGAVAILVAGEPLIRDLELGPTQIFYVTDASLRSIPRTGGPPTVLATGLLHARAVASDATHIYVACAGTAPAAADGSIVRIAIDGGAALVLASNRATSRALTLADGDVYFVGAGTPAANYADGYIAKVAADGGGGTSLVAQDLLDPWELEIDATRLFYRTRNTIWSVPRAGGVPTVVVAPAGNYGDLTLAGGYLYWAFDDVDAHLEALMLSKVLRIAVAGGTSAPIATNQSFVDSIAVDGEHVVWADRTYFATQGQVRTIVP